VDLLQPVKIVHLGDRMAAADEARNRRCADVLADALHDVGARLAVGLREPAGKRALDQRRHAFFLRGLDAVAPHLRRVGRSPAGGVREHHALEHARILERESLGDHPAHRQPGQCVFLMPRVSSSPFTSSASCSSVYSPSGALDWPWPRVSKRKTLYFPMSAFIWGSHMCRLHASEWLMVSHGPLPSIS